MDELIEYLEDYDAVQFLVSLDNNEVDPMNYSCSEWENLYSELGEFGNNPLILNTDPDHYIHSMFAQNTYSAYAFIDHNMILRYKFDMPNLYDFQYIYLPNLIDEMYGCTNPTACNFNIQAVIDDESCQFDDECTNCQEGFDQLSCMEIAGCMWMGDHCMETNDDCMTIDNQLDCTIEIGCYWMGDHCMTGASCSDPIAYNYNPIADELENDNNSACIYSSFIIQGCTYESAYNFNPSANVDDGSCEYSFADLNEDGTINILDIITLVNIILGNNQ